MIYLKNNYISCVINNNNNNNIDRKNDVNIYGEELLALLNAVSNSSIVINMIKERDTARYKEIYNSYFDFVHDLNNTVSSYFFFDDDFQIKEKIKEYNIFLQKIANAYGEYSYIYKKLQDCNFVQILDSILVKKYFC